MMLMLSKNFSANEMSRSEYAIRHGIVNVADATVLARQTRLCTVVLEVVRSFFGLPVIVTSGYRCPQVNGGVGGTKTSQHLTGEAADFTVPGVSNLAVCRLMLKERVPFDQLIYEFGEDGWVHVSHSVDGEQRGETMRADWVKGLKTYSAWNFTGDWPRR